MERHLTLTCVGDLMLEAFADAQPIGCTQRTYLADHGTAAVGGAALTLCWYLNQLKRQSHLVAGFGFAERDRVEAELKKASIDIKSLVQLSGITDILAILPGKNVSAVYIRGNLKRSNLVALSDGMRGSDLIVFGGSRHKCFRETVFEKITEHVTTQFIFSPSYSVYDFEPEELNSFIAASDITVVNEHEADYLVGLLDKVDTAHLMKLTKRGGVVTRGSSGADLFFDNRIEHIPSISGQSEDIVGAGEAFLSGFIHEFLASENWMESAMVGCAVAAQAVQSVPRRIRATINSERLARDLKRYRN